MSRSIWATALAACAVALVLFTAALLPGVALAAPGDNAPSHTHHPVLLGLGSGFQTPSRAVRSLQTKLTADGFSPGPVDGRFGPLTRAAVARFQRADGLAVDGIVGPRTRHGLAAGGLLPGAGSIRARLARSSGCNGALQRSGFSPGQADGRYGPRTMAAVKRFQHARHLAASGIASAATLRALANHTRRPTPAPGPASPSPRPSSTRPRPSPGRHPPTPTQPPPSRPSTSPRASRGRSCCCSARWRSQRWRCSRSAAASPAGACPRADRSPAGLRAAQRRSPAAADADPSPDARLRR